MLECGNAVPSMAAWTYGEIGPRPNAIILILDPRVGFKDVPNLRDALSGISLEIVEITLSIWDKDNWWSPETETMHLSTFLVSGSKRGLCNASLAFLIRSPSSPKDSVIPISPEG